MKSVQLTSDYHTVNGNGVRPNTIFEILCCKEKDVLSNDLKNLNFDTVKYNRIILSGMTYLGDYEEGDMVKYIFSYHDIHSLTSFIGFIKYKKQNVPIFVSSIMPILRMSKIFNSSPKHDCIKVEYLVSETDADYIQELSENNFDYVVIKYGSDYYLIKTTDMMPNSWMMEDNILFIMKFELSVDEENNHIIIKNDNLLLREIKIQNILNH